MRLLFDHKRTAESVTMKKICLIVIATALASCSSTPTEQEINAADFGRSMTEADCLATAMPFITARMGDPQSVIFEDLKCYRGLEGAVPVARVGATYGYRFTGRVDSKGIIGRYSGMTPFSGIVKDDGDGPRVVRYCITSGTTDYRFCIPSLVD